MLEALQNYFLTKNEPTKSCLLTLRDVIIEHDNAITETVKYGMPCYCYKTKIFCYLWTNKKNNEPYILFVEGKQLNHPALEAGERSQMKILSINPNKDLPISIIQTIINSALDLYKNEIIKIKYTFHSSKMSWKQMLLYYL